MIEAILAVEPLEGYSICYDVSLDGDPAFALILNDDLVELTPLTSCCSNDCILRRSHTSQTITYFCSKCGDEVLTLASRPTLATLAEAWRATVEAWLDEKSLVSPLQQSLQVEEVLTFVLRLTEPGRGVSDYWAYCDAETGRRRVQDALAALA